MTSGPTILLLCPVDRGLWIGSGAISGPIRPSSRRVFLYPESPKALDTASSPKTLRAGEEGYEKEDEDKLGRVGAAEGSSKISKEGG